MLLNSLKLLPYVAHPEDPVVLLLDKGVELGEVEDQDHAAQDGEDATHNLHSCAHKVILLYVPLPYITYLIDSWPKLSLAAFWTI